ncbi:MAG: alpha-galactosidase [Leptolinea sp.]|nr:alpha-galactosidase [Leptolinea sp.]
MSSKPTIVLSKFQFGDILVEYLLDNMTQNVGFQIIPITLQTKRCSRREILENPETLLLPDFMPAIRAWQPEQLVQVKLSGDPLKGFSQGVTMRNSLSTTDLSYSGQEIFHGDEITEVVTTLRSLRGYACEHHLIYKNGDQALTVQSVIRNECQKPLDLELLTSFSISGLTPFAPDDAPDRLFLHRFRSAWSAEGRHVCESIEDLNLERSWSGHGVRSERYGQVGSMPVRGYFPFIGVEDRKESVFWGAQLVWAGSWQMEAYRCDDQLSFSGGLADYEFGHWQKRILPGETFSSPLAVVSTVRGDLDDLCHRLTSMQNHTPEQVPAPEESLPVIANEWCTSWGKPEHNRLVQIARRLNDSGTKYLVIDAGWYRSDEGNWEFSQGEWVPNKIQFPDGIAATAQAIQGQGLIPGIWFEFEVVGDQSPLFESSNNHLLRLNGIPVTAGKRRFWDFRDPWVHDYLYKKVISFLRETGIGYIKVDYNEAIGVGVDGCESPGEGLRQHILGVQKFFGKMREELPHLVIEVCASGGHRLEPSMLSLSSMGSFSDAHESPEIPIIAANLHRLILPRQSQIWAVLHTSDTTQRLAYSLSAGFLGRLCLSGELDCLSDLQWSFVKDAIRFYENVSPVIKNGKSRLYQKTKNSWRHPQGVQAVVRVADDGFSALVVVHSFALPVPETLNLSLPEGDWSIVETFPVKTIPAEIEGNSLQFLPSVEFEGNVFFLKKKRESYPTS